MRGFLLTLVVLAAIVLLIVPYFVLPPALENLVARDVQERLGLTERPGVELETGFYFVARTERLRDRHVRGFRDWLAEEANRRIGDPP